MKHPQPVYRPHPLALGTGLAAGMVISFPLLIGDAAGRVNLLHLVALYVGFPVLGLILTLVTQFSSKPPALGTLLSRWASRWPSWRSAFRHWRRLGLTQAWITVETQWLAMAFSLGSIAALVVSLLFNDTHFVWRSTLLEPEQLYPFLEQVARPWAWLGWGQPSLDLLQATRDVRLGPTLVDVQQSGQWWRYLLACQLFYGVGLRALTVTLAAWKGKTIAPPAIHPESMHDVPENGVRLAAAHHHPLQPGSILVWGDLEPSWVEQVRKRVSDTPPPAISLESAEDGESPEPWLVLVKAWEPPLAELGDRLKVRSGMIVPVDGDGDRLRPAKHQHLEEWRRFAAQCGDWQVWEIVP